MSAQALLESIRFENRIRGLEFARARVASAEIDWQRIPHARSLRSGTQSVSCTQGQVKNRVTTCGSGRTFQAYRRELRTSRFMANKQRRPAISAREILELGDIFHHVAKSFFHDADS